MLSIIEEKTIINNLILEGVKEIFRIGMDVSGSTLGTLEDEVILFMKAIQSKNKIYDFAVAIDYNSLFRRFEGKIAYSLIKSDDNMYQDLIEFSF